MADALFGVDTTGQVLVLVQTNNRARNATKAEARNRNGKVVQTDAYSTETVVDYEAIVSEGEIIPDAGTSITIGAEALLVDGNVRRESNTDYIRASITASNKDASTIKVYPHTGPAT